MYLFREDLDIYKRAVAAHRSFPLLFLSQSNTSDNFAAFHRLIITWKGCSASLSFSLLFWLASPWLLPFPSQSLRKVSYTIVHTSFSDGNPALLLLTAQTSYSICRPIWSALSVQTPNCSPRLNYELGRSADNPLSRPPLPRIPLPIWRDLQ